MSLLQWNFVVSLIQKAITVLFSKRNLNHGQCEPLSSEAKSAYICTCLFSTKISQIIELLLWNARDRKTKINLMIGSERSSSKSKKRAKRHLSLASSLDSRVLAQQFHRNLLSSRKKALKISANFGDSASKRLSLGKSSSSDHYLQTK